MRVPFADLRDTLRDIQVKHGMSPARAELSARLFAEASADGFPSHGLNRFRPFIASIERGLVVVNATPTCASGNGALERWDGQRGPGNLNAHRCMARAIELAHNHGVGVVALANTNHWMRGGAYGWQAADAGVVGMCWTNTFPNLPPWGATSVRIGNNSLVIAVPRTDGHVVLDMAMSQFSYGALAVARMRGTELPVDGGYDAEGKLTRDPAAIEATGRLLPTGYWKGSGLAIVLDMVAALLSGGRSTHEIPGGVAAETGQSQVFLCFDTSVPGAADAKSTVAGRIIDDLHLAGEDVRYPGERTLKTRLLSHAEGVEVDDAIWTTVRAMSSQA